MNHFDKHLKGLKNKGYTTEPSYKNKEHEKMIKGAMEKSEKFHKEKLGKTMSYGKHFIGSAINKTLDKHK